MFHRNPITFHFLLPSLEGVVRSGGRLVAKAGAFWLVYVFFTDIGRFSRNAASCALFICKPPL
jgi:hypothetical protein